MFTQLSEFNAKLSFGASCPLKILAIQYACRVGRRIFDAVIVQSIHSVGQYHCSCLVTCYSLDIHEQMCVLVRSSRKTSSRIILFYDVLMLFYDAL